jgi:hypothetical protein
VLQAKAGVRNQRRSEIGLAAYSVSYPVNLVLVVKAADFVEKIKCYEKFLKLSEHLSRQALDLVCIVKRAIHFSPHYSLPLQLENYNTRARWGKVNRSAPSPQKKQSFQSPPLEIIRRARGEKLKFNWGQETGGKMR